MAKRSRFQWVESQTQEAQPQEDERPSRSQKKREATALQALGEALTTLDRTSYAHIDLPQELRQALAAYATMTTHEAKRRQRQLIGKHMRSLSSETIAELTDLLPTQNNS